ncbi:hypothetical protein COCMIDRAFT_40950 [Bipolaris oryzae ATCC 44560]|uniref:N-acetyltransferase domain-containing protein n=1 Tax=Bipolaris oryzae ATCC 44560 TaxID=930090 RepID=W6ZAQ0_COCMI|nr:uncharacterized protein COCMIDRAFT_40950 [Bipolaris oryzae ATCC 44560]EUC40781.1 hypothetical protein COCMIDRAFT_40950 [Bipolaris oryzae ATCC 44560]
MPLEVVFRAATPHDVDSIVSVVLKAMPFDPQFDYRFVYKKQFPEDHYKYTRILYEEFISPINDDWLVMVAEVPASPASKPATIVGFAVWDVSYINKAKYGHSYEPQNPTLAVARKGGAQRRDVAPHRQAAFKAGCTEEEAKLEELWGDRQLHLQILGVHPRYRRKHVGSRLVKWGLQKGCEDGVPVTLIAGEFGLSLYKTLGFQEFGTFVTQAQGEDLKIHSWGMVFEKSR